MLRGRQSGQRLSRPDDPAKWVFRADHLSLAIDAAVRGGNDTDTVVAIAGGLVGAAASSTAISSFNSICSAISFPRD
jgi:ADP-ribosylglycohydrolase